MNIRENDPILSDDGSRIIAYWAVSIDMPESATLYSFKVSSNMEPAAACAERGDKFEQPPTATIASFVAMPDRTYWQIMDHAPDGWMNDRRFKPAQEPSASPAGMVAAYDLVMGDKNLDLVIGPQLMQAIEHVRGYWKYRAERSIK
jgi:hypothetical protein